jgi:hypothetical protein
LSQKHLKTALNQIPMSTSKHKNIIMKHKLLLVLYLLFASALYTHARIGDTYTASVKELYNNNLYICAFLPVALRVAFRYAQAQPAQSADSLHS